MSGKKTERSYGKRTCEFRKGIQERFLQRFMINIQRPTSLKTFLL